MGFVPADLGIANPSTLKADLGNTFKFFPMTWAILFMEPHDVPNFPTYGNNLNYRNLPNYFKIHRRWPLCDFIGLV